MTIGVCKIMQPVFLILTYRFDVSPPRPLLVTLESEIVSRLRTHMFDVFIESEFLDLQFSEFL